ncbi:DUF5082 family protein [Bacillus sp. JCM 19041]|uniref:YwqH-like family protein n=1 Tax=Bacillus sp. JCM 19041 TaxID=1460637 RepID=UPI0006CFA5A2
MSVESFRQRISLLESGIVEDQERLSRLRSCRARLIGQESIMSHSNTKFKEPVLTQATWAGKQADQFEDLRETEVVSPYQDLLDAVGDAIERTERKISERTDALTLQYSNLSNARAGLENALERERNK